MLTIHNYSKYWLAFIGIGLIALHLNSSELYSQTASLSHNYLFWTVVLFLLWEKRSSLPMKSDIASSFAGTVLLSLVLYKSLHLFPGDFFLRIFPLLSLIGWGLVASGLKEWRHYNKELFLLLFLAIPWEFVYVFDISQLTAQFSNFLLWILGFEVTRQSVWIVMPTGSVEVYNGCSGVRTIVQLLGLTWILLALVPTTWKQKILLPIASILLGFTINGMRIALMAVLVALSNLEGFAYWHTGNGSLVFSAISVLIFASMCWFVLYRRKFQL